MNACAICGDKIQRTIPRAQYGRNTVQRPWVHADYRKNYDHQGTPDPGPILAGDGYDFHGVTGKALRRVNER